MAELNLPPRSTLNDYLYKGRTDEEIFTFETQEDLKRRYGSRIASMRICDTELIVSDTETFRNIQQALREQNCTTNATLRQNLHSLIRNATHEIEWKRKMERKYPQSKISNGNECIREISTRIITKDSMNLLEIGKGETREESTARCSPGEGARQA
jgi:hypothetical protein